MLPLPLLVWAEPALCVNSTLDNMIPVDVAAEGCVGNLGILSRAAERFLQHSSFYYWPPDFIVVNQSQVILQQSTNRLHNHPHMAVSSILVVHWSFLHSACWKFSNSFCISEVQDVVLSY